MRPRYKLIKIAFLVSTLGLLYLLNQSSFKSTLRLWTLDFSRNFFSAGQLFFHHLTGGISKIGDSVDVYKDRDRYRLEVSRLQQQLIQYKEAKIENERFRALLGFRERSDFSGEVAAIIGRDMSSISEMIIIDRGKSKGVDIGRVVMSYDGLVGHVIQAGDNHAEVLLINDLKARVCVMGQRTRDAGIIEGTPTHLLKMKHLDINSNIRIGDVVMTSGFGDIFPKNIPVGIVEMMGTEADNLHLYALVAPYVNFSKLEEVLCLNNE